MAKRSTGQASSRNDAAAPVLTQSERFMQAARELECDDDPERFADRVRRIVKVSPVPEAKPAKDNGS